MGTCSAFFLLVFSYTTVPHLGSGLRSFPADQHRLLLFYESRVKENDHGQVQRKVCVTVGKMDSFSPCVSRLGGGGGGGGYAGV